MLRRRIAVDRPVAFGEESGDAVGGPGLLRGRRFHFQRRFLAEQPQPDDPTPHRGALQVRAAFFQKPAQRLPLECVDRGAHSAAVERFQDLPVRETLQHGMAEPDRTQQRRIDRHDDRLHAQFRGDRAGVLAAGAAEADQGVVRRVVAARDGDAANRVGHPFVGDREEAPEEPLSPAAEPRQRLGGAPLGSRDVDGQAEGRRIDPPQQQVDVGDRERSAGPVAGGAGARAGALGTHLELTVIDPADRAAAGGHRLDRQRRGHDDRVADAELEVVLEVAVVAGDVRAGAAHVEPDHALVAARAPRRGSADHAPGRARQQAVLGAVAREAREAAGARHDPRRDAAALARIRPAAARKRRARRLEVAADGPTQVGIDDGRVRARHDLDQGRQFGRARDGPEAGGAQDALGAPLVVRVPVAVHEGDGRGAEALVDQSAGGAFQGVFVERHKLPARGVEPSRDLDRPLVERRRTLDREREDVGPSLVADEQQVAEPLGDEERRPRPRPLEQGVRAPRRGEPQVARRQGLAQRRAGGDARREDRRVLRRHELQHLAGTVDGIAGAGHGGPEPAGSVRRPPLHQRRRALAKGRRAVAGEEAIRQVEARLEPRPPGAVRDHGRPDRARAQDLHAPGRPLRVDGDAVGERAARIDPELPEGRHGEIRFRGRPAQAPASSRTRRSIRRSPSGSSRCARRSNFSAAFRSPRRSRTSPRAAAGAASSGPSRRARL